MSSRNVANTCRVAASAVSRFKAMARLSFPRSVISRQLTASPQIKELVPGISEAYTSSHARW